MHKENSKNKYGEYFAVAAFIILVGATGYGGYRFYLLSLDMEETQQNLASTKQLLVEMKNDSENKIASFMNNVENLERDNFLLTEALQNERDKNTELENRNTDLRSRIANISEELDVYKKLDELDPEMLKKYSRVYFLSEHYEPSILSDIPEKYVYDRTADDEDEHKAEQIHDKVWSFIVDMLQQAENKDIDLKVLSGYRSFGEQLELKDKYVVLYGEGTANRFSADQGYSEHQLGTTVDFITEGIDRSLQGFENTEAYQWLLNNAYKYGFVLSYPEENEHYVFEPWHWRFVGRELAEYLYNNNMFFYDMPQREIDQYLLNIFD